MLDWTTPCVVRSLPLMNALAFRLALIATVVYALIRGGRDERIVAITCILGSLATHFLISPAYERFQSVETAVMLIDGTVLGAFVVVALQSNRFWPLWVAGLQLTTLLSHLLKTIEANLIPRAYSASLAFWAYPILLILAVGTWRARRRSLDEVAVPGHSGSDLLH